MIIGITSDHKGYELKNKIINKMGNLYEIKDLGPYEEGSVDYPVMALKLGKAIINKDVDFGICICGTGIGISIAMNKVKGIRCALVHDKKEAALAKEHNIANCLAFKGSMKVNKVYKMINEYVNTMYTKEERHLKRVKQIEEIEKNQCL